jgi:hypothetical protein
VDLPFELAQLVCQGPVLVLQKVNVRLHIFYLPVSIKDNLPALVQLQFHFI